MYRYDQFDETLVREQTKDIMTVHRIKEEKNLYDFLPLHGEDDVEIVPDGDALRLKIFFEAPDDSRKCVRVIEFVGVHDYVVDLVPGNATIPSPPDLDPDQITSTLGSLIEYENSGWISAIYGGPNRQVSKHYALRPFPVAAPRSGLKHYSVYFQSVEMVVHVACQSWKIDQPALEQ